MISKLLRVLLAAGILLGSSLLALPASADHSISFVDCSPPESPPPEPLPSPTPDPGCVPEEGEAVRGTTTLRVQAWVPTAFPIQAPLSRVAVWVETDDDELEPDQVMLFEEEYEEDHQDGDPAPGKRAFDETFDWDTVSQTPLNGRYKLVAEATTHDPGHPPKLAERELIVDNLPQTPEAPIVSEVTTSAVSLEWAKAPEPDVVGYILFRAATAPEEAAETLEAVALPTGESYVDEEVQRGVTYRYGLRVLRRSVVSEQGLRWSELGPMSGDVSIAPAPTPGDRAPPPSVRNRPRPSVRAPSSSRTPAPETPFDYELPYDQDNAVRGAQSTEAGADPRGPMLPVAVGAFLVSAALALGRMPY